MHARREYSISAYVGDANQFYGANKGQAVNKESLMSAFQQVAALFGFRLTGQLVDNNYPTDSAAL